MDTPQRLTLQICLLTLAMMVAGIRISNPVLVIGNAALFTVWMAGTGWWSALRADEPPFPDHVAVGAARLIAFAWGWAGVAMLGCYYLTSLDWQHAWQYGAGMLIIAAGVWWYAGRRAAGDDMLTSIPVVAAAWWMTLLQGLAALVGVLVLVFSGKLEAGKQDWAANVIFIAGGLALFALSMAALRAERRHGRV